MYCRRHKGTGLCLVFGAEAVLNQEQTFCEEHQGTPMVACAGILTPGDQGLQ